MIPTGKLFIVTSALNAKHTTIAPKMRFEQTVEGLETLKIMFPNATTILVDGSPIKVEEEKIKILSKYVHIVADFSSDKDIAQFANIGKKSEAETVLLIKTLLLFKQDPGLAKLLHSIDRIFKFSGRTNLLNTFDIKKHNHYGKFVFKKRIPTWLIDKRKQFATDLLITRFYSFCPSLIDEYIQILQKNMGLLVQTQIDTEHAHFVNINKQYLVELDNIHCQGIMGGDGSTEIY